LASDLLESSISVAICIFSVFDVVIKDFFAILIVLATAAFFVSGRVVLI